MWDNISIAVQALQSSIWEGTSIDVLRLDQLHPVVSGNKWFKLRFYLDAALRSGAGTIATFGGAYSNHLVATSYACRQAGLNSVGIVRGEAAATMSPTLEEAAEYGMQLIFVSREAYRNKTAIMQQYAHENWYWVAEGGYGAEGCKGAATILDQVHKETYTDIIASCGTGTTLAGLATAAGSAQRIIGISALKGHDGLRQGIMQLLGPSHQDKELMLDHGYHFGGYAKHPPLLIDWMNELWEAERMPTDIVYTAKLFFAVHDLVKRGMFRGNRRVLVIHSGGLQGNRSLPAGTLAF